MWQIGKIKNVFVYILINQPRWPAITLKRLQYGYNTGAKRLVVHTLLVKNSEISFTVANNIYFDLIKKLILDSPGAISLKILQLRLYLYFILFALEWLNASTALGHKWIPSAERWADHRCWGPPPPPDHRVPCPIKGGSYSCDQVVALSMPSEMVGIWAVLFTWQYTS